jgi:hypothetical protein
VEDPALGVERAAATAAFCAGACSAAGREDCTKTCRRCDFDVNNFTQIGGYVLTCAGAMPAACGMAVGYQTCILKCSGGSSTSSNGDEGGSGSATAANSPGGDDFGADVSGELGGGE